MRKRLQPRVPRFDIRLRQTQAGRALDRRISQIEEFVTSQSPVPEGRPVLFFNASTRIHQLSLNAAYSLLGSWGVRLAGAPVRYIVCQEGLDLCILGTRLDDLQGDPPCKICMRRSEAFFPDPYVISLHLDPEMMRAAAAETAELAMPDLSQWEFHGLALGELCLPGLRWALRRHHLQNDETTVATFRRYLVSAASLAARIGELIVQQSPRALVVFNGIFYPEAVARQVALKHDVPVITHEVGLRPFSAFFSHRHATFREVDLANAAPLRQHQQARLDSYLDDRRSGRFSMAGIRFWPEMQPLPDQLIQRMRNHAQTVVIFTNVVFDTSQVHASSIFPDMFAWLTEIRRVIDQHPETYFVIRAHPDEDRPGKESRESVADWIEQAQVNERSNAAFLGPSEYIDSYALTELSDLILIYNSSIGLEASIMGKPVLAAGSARFTRASTVMTADDRESYLAKLVSLLEGKEIPDTSDFRHNSRELLYHELYRASLDLSEFLEPFPDAPGMVSLAKFSGERIGSSEAIGAIVRGILEGRPFFNSQPAYASDLG